MRLEILLPGPLHILASRTWLGLCAKRINMSTLGFHHGVASGWQKIEKQQSLHLDNSREEEWMAEQKQDVSQIQLPKSRDSETTAWGGGGGWGGTMELGESPTGRARCDFPTLLCAMAWRGPRHEEASVKITWHQVEMLSHPLI